MSKLIAASRQATGLDKTRVLLETRIRELNDESKKCAEVATTAKEKGKELLNLVEELKADAVEKDTRLDHLQRKNDKLSTLLSNAKVDAVAEFKSSNEYTKLLDANYAAGFEDFKMETMETSLKWTLTPLSLIWLLLPALCFKLALRRSMLRMMLQPCLPRTTPKQTPPQFKDGTFVILVFFLFTYFGFYLVLCFLDLFM